MSVMLEIAEEMKKCQRAADVRKVIQKAVPQLQELMQEATMSDLEKNIERMRKAAGAADKTKEARDLDENLENLLSNSAEQLGQLLKAGTGVAAQTLQLTSMAAAVGSAVVEVMGVLAECVPLLGNVVQLVRFAKRRWEK